MNPILSRLFRTLLALLLTYSMASYAIEESITYIHTDHLGSPILAADENGDVKWREDYQPYGTQLINQDSDNSVGFTGHKDDKTLGIAYMQGRWYLPEMGRFAAIDPVGFVEGNPGSFNRYSYVNNNPYKFIDPDGENAVTAFGGLLVESTNWAFGGEFNGSNVLGALKDGYDGEGDGFVTAAIDDLTTFVPAGAAIGVAGRAVRLVKSLKVTKNAGRVIKCFPPGTLVLMADGTTKPIEEVEVGDEVFAMDAENGGDVVARLVTDTHQNKTMRLFVVQFDVDQDGISDGEFKATGEHPIWTSNAGWRDTQDLTIGDVLLTDHKEPIEVLNISIEEGFSQTHNLSVDDINTFFIVPDDTPILVHNTPRIHGVAPDWAVKGAHVTTSNGIELSIRGGGNGISIKPVFSADASSSKLNAAIAETKAALNDPKWRGTLLDRTRKATEMLGKGSALDRAGSGGTRALEVALEKWCK